MHVPAGHGFLLPPGVAFALTLGPAIAACSYIRAQASKAQALLISKGLLLFFFYFFFYSTIRALLGALTCSKNS